jgi:hypothetical protein
MRNGIKGRYLISMTMAILFMVAAAFLAQTIHPPKASALLKGIVVPIVSPKEGQSTPNSDEDEESDEKEKASASDIRIPSVPAETPIVKIETPEVKVKPMETEPQITVTVPPTKVQTPIVKAETSPVKSAVKSGRGSLPEGRVKEPSAQVTAPATAAETSVSRIGISEPAAQSNPDAINVEPFIPDQDVKQSQPAVPETPTVVQPKPNEKSATESGSLANRKANATPAYKPVGFSNGSGGKQRVVPRLPVEKPRTPTSMGILSAGVPVVGPSGAAQGSGPVGGLNGGTPLTIIEQLNYLSPNESVRTIYGLYLLSSDQWCQPPPVHPPMGAFFSNHLIIN